MEFLGEVADPQQALRGPRQGGGDAASFQHLYRFLHVIMFLYISRCFNALLLGCFAGVILRLLRVPRQGDGGAAGVRGTGVTSRLLGVLLHLLGVVALRNEHHISKDANITRNTDTLSYDNSINKNNSNNNNNNNSIRFTTYICTSSASSRASSASPGGRRR